MYDELINRPLNMHVKDANGYLTSESRRSPVVHMSQLPPLSAIALETFAGPEDYRALCASTNRFGP